MIAQCALRGWWGAGPPGVGTKEHARPKENSDGETVGAEDPDLITDRERTTGIVMEVGHPVIEVHVAPVVERHPYEGIRSIVPAVADDRAAHAALC